MVEGDHEDPFVLAHLVAAAGHLHLIRKYRYKVSSTYCICIDLYYNFKNASPSGGGRREKEAEVAVPPISSADC